MKTISHSTKAGPSKLRVFGALLVWALFLPLVGYALSISIGRDIQFPKGYDETKAAAIRKVIQNPRYEFVGGIVSMWEPDYGTRLSFEGDASKLSEFFGELRRLPGISTKLILYRGRNDELRRDSAWQLDFSQAHPDQLTVYLNLNSKQIEFDKLALPEWPAK
jgi:hypothetical protein